MFESELDYSVKIGSFVYNDKLNKLIIKYTNDFINSEIDRNEYVKSSYDLLNIISTKTEDKNKYLLYNISDITSLNVRYMYNTFFINTSAKKQTDLLIIILSRLNNRALDEISNSNYKLSVVIDFYKAYSFVYLILSNLINDGNIFKDNTNKFKKLLNFLKKSQFKEFRRLSSYYNIKNSNKNKINNFSKLKIDLLKINNLNKEIVNILNYYETDTVLSYILNILHYILFLYCFRVKIFLKINS